LVSRDHRLKEILKEERKLVSDLKNLKIGEIEKILSGPERDAIVNYIKKNPGTTADKVAKYLQDNKVCSRLTTLKAIKRLIELDVIRDDRKGRYFHHLYFNEDFQFKSIAYDSLIDYLNDLRKLYSKYSTDNRHNQMFDRIESIVKQYKKQMDGMYALENLVKQQFKAVEREHTHMPDI
jgi:predicted ArsR family transcriptional regulator